MLFWTICCERAARLFNKFRPSDWASLASYMNTLIFLQRKEWQGEILETKPAWLTGLI